MPDKRFQAWRMRWIPDKRFREWRMMWMSDKSAQAWQKEGVIPEWFYEEFKLLKGKSIWIPD